MTKLCVRGGYEWVEGIAEALDVVERECGYDLREYIERTMDRMDSDAEKLRTEIGKQDDEIINLEQERDAAQLDAEDLREQIKKQSRLIADMKIASEKRGKRYDKLRSDAESVTHMLDDLADKYSDLLLEMRDFEEEEE